MRKSEKWKRGLRICVTWHNRRLFRRFSFTLKLKNSHRNHFSFHIFEHVTLNFKKWRDMNDFWGENIFCEVGSNNEKAPKGKIDKAPKIMNHNLTEAMSHHLTEWFNQFVPNPRSWFEGMISENCDSLLEIQFFTELEEFICNTYVTYDMYWNMWLLGTYF